jgi:hypothetical protein
MKEFSIPTHKLYFIGAFFCILFIVVQFLKGPPSIYENTELTKSALPVIDALKVSHSNYFSCDGKKTLKAQLATYESIFILNANKDEAKFITPGLNFSIPCPTTYPLVITSEGMVNEEIPKSLFVGVNEMDADWKSKNSEDRKLKMIMIANFIKEHSAYFEKHKPDGSVGPLRPPL